MTKLGLLVAMAAEGRSRTSRRVPAGGCLDLNDGCLIGFSGAGPNAAERSAKVLVEAGATALISWGCAAALDPSLNPGDLVLPTQIIGLNGATPMETDQAWRTRLAFQLKGQLPVFAGLLAESDRIVATAEEKRAIFAATGSIALDMESGAAARSARKFNLPFLAIRSIIDPAHVTIPPSIERAFDANGMLHVPTLLFHSLLRPSDFYGVIQLGRHFGCAMKTLKLVAKIGRETHFALV